ncbi:integrase [Xylophilus ampelinus]|uniref:Integrase n=1 Tax=Xylophilus ampelinus TaxID=54067 RepID=A0A318SJ36_9BURK|nr:integrase [Xylophilus ampelinus]
MCPHLCPQTHDGTPLKLTDAKLRTLTKPGKHADGAGLYLEVTAAGGRYWRWKYRINGKEKRLAFGVYPQVGLKEARERLDVARQALQRGDDPGELRKAAKVKTAFESVNTFEAVATDWLQHQAGKWIPATRERVRSSLAADIFPAFGGRPMASLQALDVMQAVKKIEARGSGDMAGRVLQRIKAVFRFAVIHKRIESNPMVDLLPAEILQPRRVQHRPALSERELPRFLAQLDGYEGDSITVQALRLLMLTAARPGEVRGARWDEFDLSAAVWRIPASRMKMRNEHLVPLSAQALAVLQTLQGISGGRELVFPSPSYQSKPLSENTFNSTLARFGYKGSATAHGFRALFSTVANERGWNPDVIERQLAHIERNEVRAAYHRSTYLDDRAKLMQWWGDHIDSLRAGVMA